MHRAPDVKAEVGHQPRHHCRDDQAARVDGPRVERLLQRFDLENEEAAAHVEHRLDRMGVIRALEEHGFEAGDAVEIAGETFELDPAS